MPKSKLILWIVAGLAFDAACILAAMIFWRLQ